MCAERVKEETKKRRPLRLGQTCKKEGGVKVTREEEKKKRQWRARGRWLCYHLVSYFPLLYCCCVCVCVWCYTHCVCVSERFGRPPFFYCDLPIFYFSVAFCARFS